MKRRARAERMTRHRHRPFVIGRGRYSIPLWWYLLFLAAIVGIQALTDIGRELHLLLFP